MRYLDQVIKIHILSFVHLPQISHLLHLVVEKRCTVLTPTADSTQPSRKVESGSDQSLPPLHCPPLVPCSCSLWPRLIFSSFSIFPVFKAPDS